MTTLTVFDGDAMLRGSMQNAMTTWTIMLKSQGERLLGEKPLAWWKDVA
jgi:hypothetical protein